MEIYSFKTAAIASEWYLCCSKYQVLEYGTEDETAMKSQWKAEIIEVTNHDV
jgi:hypothetical protein